VIKTAEKVKAAYSIVISERAGEIEYNKKENALKIPLKYFLLM